MSEKAQAPTKEKTQNKAAKEAKSGVVKSENTVKDTGPKWTLARCQKYARRFANEAQWAAGAPASYKSAVAHGWLDQCLQVTGGKVVTGNFRPKGVGTSSDKKAA